MDTLQPGDKIQITFVDAPGETLEATVCSALSDAEEGLGPEIQDYVACWLEITLGSCDHPESRRSVTLGTDFQYDMGGRKLTITKLTS